MSVDTPAVDSVWIERRPEGIVPELRATNRRLVRVTAADRTNVEGVGWWQERYNGEWIDGDWPGVKRKTRILTASFLARFDPLPEETP